MSAKKTTIPATPWWSRNGFLLACIVGVGILLYAHTLNVPWYMDDLHAIIENTNVHRLPEAFGKLLAPRGIADLTFALNYRFGGTDVTGYHLVNIAIHLLTSCLVFLLLKRVFRDRPLLSLGGALIFVAHPLQTQAVTYIVQRMTSLAALFFFLSLYLYVRARESSGKEGGREWLLYAGALLAGAVAVLVKQNTAVLPVAIVLFDRYFLPAEGRLPWRRLLALVAPFALVPIVIAARSLLVPMVAEGGIAGVGGMPDLVHLQNNSPLNYLATEFSVVWIYLRLLFFPWGQALDYDLPIVSTLWQWRTAVAFLGVAGLLAAAVCLRRRQPLVSAGILWFFLGLAVESTIIPLDPVFEHRLYIPMFGFALVVMAIVALLPPRGATAAIVAITVVLGGLAWQRNALWNDPVAFHEDNLRRAPRSERVHLDLANIYMKRGRVAEAQTLYERALEINPGYILVHINLSRVYAAQNQYGKAVEVLLEGVRRNPNHFKLYNNLGVLYNAMGEHRLAAGYLSKGAALEPDNATVHFNLGLSCEKLGMVDEAIFHYRRSIALEYGSPESHFNLGTALFKKGDQRGALEAFLTASRLNPRHAGSLFNLALTYLSLGDPGSARNVAAQLQRLDPAMARQLLLRIDQGG